MKPAWRVEPAGDRVYVYYHNKLRFIGGDLVTAQAYIARYREGDEKVIKVEEVDGYRVDITKEIKKRRSTR